MSKLNNKNNLDEMEFTHAAEIRVVEEQKNNKNKNTGTLLYWSVILLLFATSVSLYFYFSNKLEPLKLQITDLTAKNKLLTDENLQLNSTLENLMTEIKGLQNKYKTSKKGKEELISIIKQLKNERKTEYNKRKQTEKQVDKLNKQLTKEKAQIKSLKKENSKLANNIKNLKKQIENIEDEKYKTELKLTKLQKQYSQLKIDYNEEIKASKEILNSMSKNKQLLITLKEKNKNLQYQLKNLKTKINKLETVETGELVPYSEKLVPAVPILKKSVIIEKNGIFNKVEGFVEVSVLIDHFGEVKNAVFLDYKVKGEADKGKIIGEALKTALKWKFTPALYNGEVKVKVWQPILIPVISE
jgi:DNA repair exonuclease SbcCD ATPase subunit